MAARASRRADGILVAEVKELKATLLERESEIESLKSKLHSRAGRERAAVEDERPKRRIH